MSCEHMRLGRRRFLFAGLSATVAGPLLAACGQGAPAATPTEAPKPAAPTTAPTAAAPKPTEAAKPAAAATAAPAATKPAEPTKQAAAATPSAGPYAVHKDVTGNITVWHWWGSPLRRNAMRRMVSGFAQEYPQTKVTEVFVPYGDIWTKNIAAVSAGSGMADVCMETQNLRDRAKNNVCIPLGDLAKRDGITGREFWPYAWEEGLYNGVPYGLPFETNVSGLFYNKSAYKDAGLDPEKPPKDWDELWAAADKLDKKGSGNKLEAIGFSPLMSAQPPSQGPRLEVWAINNGGSWADKEGNPTFTLKENIEALAWMKKWVDRHSKSALDALRGSFGPQGPQDGFMSGKLISCTDGQSYVSFLNLFNAGGLAPFRTKDKEQLGWGYSPMPSAPGKKPAFFSRSYKITIPRGVKQIDAAWEWVKYQAFVGQQSYARDAYHIPTVREVAMKDPVLNADPMWGVFIKWMDYGQPAPFNPYVADMFTFITPATDAVLAGKQIPEQALEDAQKKVEAEIAKNRR